MVNDEKDRRIKHLYLTDLAIPAAKRIKEIHNSFYETLCMDIPSEDVHSLYALVIYASNRV